MTERLNYGTDPLSLLLSRLSPPSTPRDDQPLFAEEDEVPAPLPSTETSSSDGAASSPTPGMCTSVWEGPKCANNKTDIGLPLWGKSAEVKGTTKASWALPPQYTQQQQALPRPPPSASIPASQQQEQALDPQTPVAALSSVPATPPIHTPSAAPMRTPVSVASPHGAPVAVEDIKLLSGEQIGANVMQVSLLVSPPLKLS